MNYRPQSLPPVGEQGEDYGLCVWVVAVAQLGVVYTSSLLIDDDQRCVVHSLSTRSEIREMNSSLSIERSERTAGFGASCTARRVLS
ncbi:hypothetical protein [Stutzerimonas stutzeri]|uniref:hypothetical protein n=1 Tax=Stutzerimonas stutzeri TaxID=316 RepID=UPI0004B7C15C|nr:hypothetical protein [Stutzerimonas stutzeri]MCQ4329441.1 hypothetical protein [Stutzerimonas stutzeri]